MRTRGLAHINGHSKTHITNHKHKTPSNDSEGQKKRPATRTDAHMERERRAEGERDREAHTRRVREGTTHTMRDMNAQTCATTHTHREGGGGRERHVDTTAESKIHRRTQEKHRSERN